MTMREQREGVLILLSVRGQLCLHSQLVERGKFMRKLALTAVVAFVAVCASYSAHAYQIGYIQDTENFPNMLQTVPTCSEAYQKYLGLAQQVSACNSLEYAQEQCSVQEAIAKHMNEFKSCKSCAKKATKASETASAYKEQIKVYKAQCPNLRKNDKMAKKLEKQHKRVCKSCNYKWPGSVGAGNGLLCK